MNANQQNKSSQTLPLEKQFNIPKALQGLVIEQGAISDIRNKRYLLSFSFDGEQEAHEIPDDACVMSTKQMLQAINEPNGVYIDADELADFAVATINRLKERHAYHIERNTEWLEQTTKAMKSVAQAVQT